MSEEQIAALARAVAREMRAQQPPQHACSFSADEIATVKRFCARAEAAEKAAVGALVKTIIVGCAALLAAGAVAWIRQKMTP